MEMKTGQIEDDGCPCGPQSETGCSVLSQKSFLPNFSKILLLLVLNLCFITHSNCPPKLSQFFSDVFSFLAPQSGPPSIGAFRDPIPSHPTHPLLSNTVLYTEAFKSSKAYYGDLWHSVAILDHK